MAFNFDVNADIDPARLRDLLEQLELELASSRVRTIFRAASNAEKNEYAMLQREVTLLRNRLTLERLAQLANDMANHNTELKKRTKLLKREFDNLATARRLLTRLDKFVSLVGRIAIFLL